MNRTTLLRNGLLGLCRKLSSRRSQSGFTLVGTAISAIIGTGILAGAWVAYTDMMIQWRVSHAERIMDQYAAAAMQELTNDLCWSWGAKQIQGGWVNPRWKFYFDDRIEEYGSMDLWKYNRGADKMIEITYRPTSGILINNVPPSWARDRFTDYYVWAGRSYAPRGYTNTMDRRDRMTVESILFDWEEFGSFPSNEESALKRQGVMVIKMTMHYTYRPTNWAEKATHLYGRNYVRERKYETKIFMRNWDVDTNRYRDIVLGLTDDNG